MAESNYEAAAAATAIRGEGGLASAQVYALLAIADQLAGIDAILADIRELLTARR